MRGVFDRNAVLEHLVPKTGYLLLVLQARVA